MKNTKYIQTSVNLWCCHYKKEYCEIRNTNVKNFQNAWVRNVYIYVHRTPMQYYIRHKRLQAESIQTPNTQNTTQTPLWKTSELGIGIPRNQNPNTGSSSCFLLALTVFQLHVHSAQHCTVCRHSKTYKLYTQTIPTTKHTN